MNIKKIGITFVLGMFLVRCGASIVGNPSPLAIKFQGDSSTALTKMNVRAQTFGDITLTQARVALGEIKLKSESDCLSGSSQSNEVEFTGPYAVDLLNNTTLPDVSEQTIIAGHYCRIEIKLKKIEVDQLPLGLSEDDLLVGHSVFVSGTRADDVMFDVYLDLDEEFKLENASGLFLLGAHDLFVQFKLYAWFSNIDLSQAVVGGNGKILIDKDNNTTLLNAIIKNIQTSARLYEDKNNDGSLSSDESHASELLGEGLD